MSSCPCGVLVVYAGILTLVESTFPYDAIFISSAGFEESGAYMHLKDALYLHLTEDTWANQG